MCAEVVPVFCSVVTAEKKIATSESHTDVGLRATAIAAIGRLKSDGAGSWSCLSHRTPFRGSGLYSTTSDRVEAEDGDVFRHKRIRPDVFPAFRPGVREQSSAELMLEAEEIQVQ